MDQFQSLLNAVTVGLNTIKGIASMPGVSALPYVGTLAAGIDVAQQLIKIGGDVTPLVTNITNTFSKPDVSEDDMTALNELIEAERAKLHAPLPPKEEGEEE